MPVMKFFLKSKVDQVDQPQQKQKRSSTSSSSTSSTLSSSEHRRSSLLNKVRRSPRSATFLVSKRRWDDVATVLSTDIGREDVIAHYELRVDQGRASESTLLHVACRNGAPLHIVEALHEVVPDMANVRDSDGRTPLHCACVASACPTTDDAADIVAYLLDVDSKSEGGRAVATKDDAGRLPLHLAAGAARESSQEDLDDAYLALQLPDDDELSSSSPPDSRVLQSLVKVHPYSANTEDDEGCTALEYAIVNGADNATVRRLRKTSEAVWKKSEKTARELTLREAKKANDCLLVRTDSTYKVKRGAMAA